MSAFPQHSPAGRRALVVGGSTGIGRGVADAWAAAGLDVTVLSRSRPTGPGADALRWSPVDLGDADAARATLARAADTGPLHAVCYAAVSYGTRRALFAETEEPEWRHQVEVNLNGLWLTLAATLGLLRRTGGVFLGISSEVVYNAGPGRAGYAATKAAAAALLDSVAQEENGLGAEGVSVVQALPAGMVDTPGIRRRRPADFDYGDYMTPADFAPLARELVTADPAAHHGDSLVVERGGRWRSVREARPVSQSRVLTA
jgi:NAD(P)-dependent dehydrogenase (short-subunit alcohol dehydrogenase family)